MSWLDSVWGQKPDVIKPDYVDLSEEQQRSLEANIQAFPQGMKVGDLYSSYLQGALEKQLPGYADVLKKGIGVAGNLLTSAAPLSLGQIPKDVQSQVYRSGAYQNLLSGGGRSYLRSLQARDLGLTSLDLMKEGAALGTAGGNSAQQWSQLASGTILNPTSWFVSPAQQAAVTAQNNSLKQAYLQNKANVAAAPSPIAKGVSDTLIGLISAYLSKGGGGGGATQPADPYSTGVQGYGSGNYGNQAGYGYMPNWGVGEVTGNYNPFAPSPNFGGDTNVNLGGSGGGGGQPSIVSNSGEYQLGDWSQAYLNSLGG